MVFEDSNARGIRYTLRLDVAEECWAVLEGTSLDFEAVTTVNFEDEDLAAAAEALSLTLAATRRDGNER